ncbi:MAG TPA: sigma-70 family RNA polymerase sigma factor [Gemmataceae bacterium]|jgi:RNA polymerase sigma factor (sigma-70 family)|nr:sigma-70 family RNA polymerase sigma factor [Gemmataceae bacterium]
MQPSDLDQRLSRIATLWTVVFRAHEGGADAAQEARNRLMLRYSGAVYRYLLGAVRDAEAAGDLCQEFALRFLRGDFRRAAPERGRFRDYVKSALINLVNDHHRAQQAKPRQLGSGLAEPALRPEVSLPSDDDFVSGWRTELLNQTWAALAEVNPAYHAALLLRIENPDMQSAEMAGRLTEKLGRPITPENARKALQRSHAKFAELLLDQVAASLTDPSDVQLGEELRALDLLKYCRSALDRRRAGS